MRVGWLGSKRKTERRTEAPPDIGVTGPKLWGMGAVIIASTAALLGTSPDDEPSTYHHYEFRLDSIDGGAVELTVDRPSATFFVNVTAVDLGPEAVVTTTDAQAHVEGTVEAAGLSDGQVPPRVDVKITSTDGKVDFHEAVMDRFSPVLVLPFKGNCLAPRSGAACAARFSVEVRRLDDGEAGGALIFAWHFALSAEARLAVRGTQEVQHDPQEPPWTVQVTEP